MIVRVYEAQLPDTTYSNLLATATQIPLFSLTVPVNLTPTVLHPAIITYSFFGFRQFRQLKRVRISILSSRVVGRLLGLCFTAFVSILLSGTQLCDQKTQTINKTVDAWI